MRDFPFYDKPMRIQFAKTQSMAAAKAEGKSVLPPAARKRRREERDDDDLRAPAAKQARTVGPAAAPAMPAVPVVTLPSRVLLVQGIPQGITADAIKGVFGQFAGLVGVRPVLERGIAFVDYDSEASATPALQGLNNFRISPEAVLSVSYARQ
jgi:U2 small nuclear ribonucleoprotein B''